MEDYDEVDIPRRVRTPSGIEIDLNNQQHSALIQMVAWLRDRDSTVFTLSGYAGTGKTTIMYVTLKYFKGQVAVSAPTHKAKKVIQRTTNRISQTIQSLLGLAPNIDLESFDPNKPEFRPKSEPKISNFELVIIDEASMLNTELFDYLITCADERRTKLLFMGDEAQLPPVGEKKSPVFTSDKVRDKAELTKVERQAGGNPLMPIYDAIRENITAPVDAFKHITNLNDVGQGIVFTDSELDFREDIRKEFSSPYYADDPDHAKILCWTNDRVKYWNKYIREMLYGLDPEPLKVGEMMMSYSTVGYGTNISLENSADYRVVSVRNWTDVKQYGTGYNDGVRQFAQAHIPMWEVRLKPTDIEKEFEDMNITRLVNVVIPSKDNYKQFLLVYEWLKTVAITAKGKEDRKRRWGEFYQFKDAHLLLHDIKSTKGKLLVRKDLDYAYAITVHKSQGSTYTLCFVDEKDIDRNKDRHEERNNLKYVAFSRPRVKVVAYCGRIDYVESEEKFDSTELMNDTLLEIRRRRDILVETGDPQLARFAKGLTQYLEYVNQHITPVSVTQNLSGETVLDNSEESTIIELTENGVAPKKFSFGYKPKTIKR